MMVGFHDDASAIAEAFNHLSLHLKEAVLGVENLVENSYIGVRPYGFLYIDKLL